ncbi:MAG: trigger factor [Gammaproteobacteria bacterium]|nr:MAG: trigger factor [Gammaproteobacteria bacterium]
MQVSVEDTGDISRKMTITVPAEELGQAYQKQLKRISKRVRMPGFRPGKVPMKMIEAQHGGEAMQEAVSELISGSLHEAMAQEEMQPVGQPAVDIRNKVELDKDLEYIATFEVYPEVGDVGIGGAKVEKPVCEISDSDVDDTLENLKKQRTVWKPVKRKSKNKDRMTLDFTGKIDGKPFAGGEAEGIQAVLGSGTFFPDFEKQLKGLKAGDEKTITVTFPDDYRASELAGKEAEFDLTISEVAEPVEPEIDKAFVRSFGVEDGKEKSLRAEIKRNLEREARSRLSRKLKEAVMDALLEQNALEVPKVLVEQEISNLVGSTQAQGVNIEDPAQRAVFEGAANRRVKLGILLANLAKQAKLEASDEQVEAKLAEMAQTYEDPEEFIKYYKSQPSEMEAVRSMVLEDVVVEHLMKDARVSEKKVKFSDLVAEEKS